MGICLVCECGWILKGTMEEEREHEIVLKDASVVRKWQNGRGIGGIAKVEYKDEYTLDYIGDVRIMRGKILFSIPCEW